MNAGPSRSGNRSLIHDYLPWGLLGLFALASFSFKMGSYPLTDHDEALYSQVARELLGHKDWWTLYYHNQPWFIHAPLGMWAQAVIFKLFGSSELTARLHSVIFATALVILTAAFGRFIFGKKAGFTAGLVLVTAPLYFAIARMALLDMPLVFFMTLAIFMFLLAWRKQDSRYYIGFWLAAGFATLDKGLWGLALPSAIVLLYAITDKERKRLLDPWLYVSMLAWFAVVSPWFIIETHRHGKDFLEPMLITNTVARLNTAVCNHTGPWYYYLPILLVGLFPWIILWPQAFFKNRGDNSRLLLIWILVPLILHSSATTKLPNYMMPLFPAFAMLLGVCAAEAKRRDVQGLIMVSLGIGIGAAVVWQLKAHSLSYTDLAAINPWTVGITAGLAYVIAGVALLRDADHGPSVMALMLALGLLLIPSCYSVSYHGVAPKDAALAARRIAGDGPVLTVSGIDCEYGLYWYSRDPFIVSGDLEGIRGILAKQKGDYGLIVPPDQVSNLKRLGVTLQVMYNKGNWVVGTAQIRDPKE
jgi:4-amino-4-deoxy-L-arabinose transferase-like glycosyltransferase